MNFYVKSFSGSILTRGKNNNVYLQYLNTCIQLCLTELEQSTSRIKWRFRLQVPCRLPSSRRNAEEGRGTYQLRFSENNNKDEDNCPNTVNDKNKYFLF